MQPQPQNHLNRLSTELLCEVFDYLGFPDQLAAAGTCARWSEILVSNRYQQQYRASLSLRTLCNHASNSHGQDIAMMKQFRSFSVDFSLDVPYMKHLQEFLSCDEVAQNVGELLLKNSSCFASTHYLYLPVLNEKWDAISGDVVLPNLRRVVMENPGWAINPLIQRYSEQVEDITLHYQSRETFLMAMGCRPFRNLHSLTLVTQKCSNYPRLEGADLRRPHLLMFHRLKYLKIVDTHGSTNSALSVIFTVAINLETLIVEGTTMSEEAFNRIDELKQLKELHLYCRVLQTPDTVHLSLPNLEKLTTCQQMPPLACVPSLRVLHIRDHMLLGGRFVFGEEEKLINYFSRFDCSLEELRLENIDLDRIIVRRICTLGKLKRLAMVGVEVEQAALYRMLKLLGGLELVKLEKCSLTVPITNVKQWREETAMDRNTWIEFVEKLRSTFKNCFIVNIGSAVVHKYLLSKREKGM